MKKYLAFLAVGLICHVSIAQEAPQVFETVDELVGSLKEQNQDNILYDKKRIIIGADLPYRYGTDRNLELLSQIKSIRYLLIGGGYMSTNAISALVKFPNLTGLCLVCCGGHKDHLIPLLPCLTNLQGLELAQTTYQTNDTIYLAKMTNLVALGVYGSVPQSRAELLPLTSLVNLRTLEIYGIQERIKNLDRSVFSRRKKLTHLVITSDPRDLHEKGPVWQTPAVN